MSKEVYFPGLAALVKENLTINFSDLSIDDVSDLVPPLPFLCCFTKWTLYEKYV